MYKKICVCGSFGEAGVIFSLLQSNDFNPLEIQVSSHVTLGGVDQGYYIQVPEAEIQGCRELLVDQGYEKNLLHN